MNPVLRGIISDNGMLDGVSLYKLQMFVLSSEVASVSNGCIRPAIFMQHLGSLNDQKKYESITFIHLGQLNRLAFFFLQCCYLEDKHD